MPLNASISPSTAPRTAPCRVQATSGPVAVQPGTCAVAVEAITANRKRARSLVKCAIVASFHVTAGPTIPPYNGNIDTADQSHCQTLEPSARLLWVQIVPQQRTFFEAGAGNILPFFGNLFPSPLPGLATEITCLVAATRLSTKFGRASGRTKIVMSYSE